MAVDIRLVQSVREVHDIYRFRYDVYVEELGRVQKHADHETRTIEEPLDRGALLWAAYEGERVVGTVRVNYARASDLGNYATLYQMARAGADHPKHTSITTKLIVAREYRSTSLAYRLAVTGYRRLLEDDIRHDFIDVYPARVPFFERLGYRVHVPEVHHEEFGDVIVMRLALSDREHLSRVGSPFLRSLDRFSQGRLKSSAA